MTTPQSTPAQDYMQEEWRPVVGYEGRYEVSSWGRVRSLLGSKGRSNPHMMRCTINGAGYRMVDLCLDGGSHCRNVHRLVAAAFLGPCPDGLQVHHIDADRANPHLSNLVYVTPSENAREAVAVHDFAPKGEANGQAKLTDDLVREIRASEETLRGLARRLGVSQAVIWSARKGLTWRHVE